MKAQTNNTQKTSAQKKKYKMTNWKEYNASLVARDAVTVWLSDAAYIPRYWQPQSSLQLTLTAKAKP